VLFRSGLFKIVSGQKPREIAVRILSERAQGEYVEEVLERRLAQAGLTPRDRHLCQELVYGAVRWRATLDWLIARKARNPLQKPALQNLLRLGLYQIFWLDRVPHHAAVHETVELAKRAGFGHQAGFINALLRGYGREFGATNQLLAELRSTQPHLGFSHPEWLVHRWQERFGLDQTRTLLAWNNTPPKTFARVNTLKADAARLLTQWRQENVEYDFVRRDWLQQNLVFELKSHPPLDHLPSFQEGLFYVQDPSTLLAVQELGPVPGERVLDLCAAPGGKLSYIAQLMRNEGQLMAHDTSPERLELLKQNCARLGVTCVQILSGFPSSPPGPPQFDRVLLDAPCSNTGVMRRRVELRWRIRPEEIERLRAGQLELMRQAAQVVAPGGTLVYSTCSLEPEENQAVVAEFLSAENGFKLQAERELRPFVDEVDGAYAARLARR
jgi:16S rRNA (cytosine967-C5)-methyltransferase